LLNFAQDKVIHNAAPKRISS